MKTSVETWVQDLDDHIEYLRASLRSHSVKERQIISHSSSAGWSVLQDFVYKRGHGLNPTVDTLVKLATSLATYEEEHARAVQS